MFRKRADSSLILEPGLRKVLLIGWGAADWGIIHPLVDAGEMPALARLIEHGTSGNLAPPHLLVPPAAWTSLATGRRPDVHGVHGFFDTDFDSGKVRPAGSRTRTCKALWNLLSENHLRCHAVGWPASHPAETINGVCVSELFALPLPRFTKPNEGGTRDEAASLLRDSVAPARFVETLVDLRVGAQEIDAQVLGLFVPQFEKIDRERDHRLGRLAVHLAECFSIHAAATWLVENEPWNFFTVHYPTIERISREFMRCQPPRLASVSERDVEIYGDVVRSAYRLHDMFLARLLALAGEETTVILVSAHGFRNGAHRPSAPADKPLGVGEEWRQRPGIFAIDGPGIVSDEIIHGANALDVAPTVLACFGLRDPSLSGRVLDEAFQTRTSLADIPETTAPFEQKNHAAEPADANFFLLNYLSDFGYIRRSPDVREAAMENKWNLARSLLGENRNREALPHFEELLHAWPESADIAMHLGQCYFRLGRIGDAEAACEVLLDQGPESPLAHFALGMIAHAKRTFTNALAHFRRAEKAGLRAPGLQNQIGFALLQLGEWEEAEQTYRRVLEINPANAEAHLGVAHSLLRRRQFQAAAEESLVALGLKFEMPLGHFNLGLALARIGRREEARQAFETCLRFAPHFSAATRCLKVLDEHAKQEPVSDMQALKSKDV